MLMTLVSSAACVASCSFLVPQLVRLVRTRDGAGVSATMAAIGALSCLAWTLYGLAASIWPLALAGALATAEYLCFCLLLRRARSPLRSAVATTAAWAVGLAAAAGLGAVTGYGAWTGLAAALNGAVVAQYLPAVLEAHRAPSTSGISLRTWAMVALNGSLWTFYGILIADWALIGYGLAVGSAAIGVAAAVARTCWSRPDRGRRHATRSRKSIAYPDLVGAEPIGERPGKHSTMMCGVAAPPRHDGLTYRRTPSASE